MSHTPAVSLTSVCIQTKNVFDWLRGEKKTHTPFDRRSAEKFSFKPKSSGRNRKESYNYNDTMQMLGTPCSYCNRHTVYADALVCCWLRSGRGWRQYRRPQHDIRRSRFLLAAASPSSSRSPANGSFLHQLSPLAKYYQLLLLLQCLSILNYFRSLERMITIYDAGLSAESEKSRGATEQNHRRGVDTDAVGGGNGLGSHSYVYNTPADFK